MNGNTKSTVNQAPSNAKPREINVPPPHVAQFRTFVAIAKKPSPVSLFWAVTGMIFGTTVAFIIATGSILNGSDTVYIPPASLQKPVVDLWQTFASPKGYSVHYKSPQFFDAQITPTSDVLTYLVNFNDKRQTAYVLTVSVEKPSLFGNKESMDTVKIGKLDALVIAQTKPDSPSFKATYLLQLDKINLKLILESSLPQTNLQIRNLKNEILKSFTVSK